jgi:hypothetical protein
MNIVHIYDKIRNYYKSTEVQRWHATVNSC